MPALPSPGAVVKAQLHWAVNSSANVMNVLHYRYQGSQPAANDLNAAAAHMTAAFGTAQTVLFPGTTTFGGVTLTDLQGNAGAQGSSQVTKPGTDPSAGVNDSTTCVLMNLHVNARYRGGHPRIYFPGAGDNHNNDGLHWVASYVSSFNSAMITFLASLNGFSSGATTFGQQCVVSYYHDKALRPIPLVLDVTSWTTNNGLASQRRRGAFA